MSITDINTAPGLTSASYPNQTFTNIVNTHSQVLYDNLSNCHTTLVTQQLSLRLGRLIEISVNRSIYNYYEPSQMKPAAILYH